MALYFGSGRGKKSPVTAVYVGMKGRRRPVTAIYIGKSGRAKLVWTPPEGEESK